MSVPKRTVQVHAKSFLVNDISDDHSIIKNTGDYLRRMGVIAPIEPTNDERKNEEVIVDEIIIEMERENEQLAAYYVAL